MCAFLALSSSPQHVTVSAREEEANSGIQTGLREGGFRIQWRSARMRLVNERGDACITVHYTILLHQYSDSFEF
jgi:hypothetical protein